MAFRPVTHYLAALLVLLALFCCGSASAVATDAQKNITYNFLKRFPQKLSQLSSWTGTDYCSWSGVSCNADGYVTLSLSGKGLSTFLPDYEGSDDTLIVGIDVSSNTGLTGNFPSSWAALKALKKLDMSDTSLYGNIPDAWNGMIALEQVKIANAGACYGLPNWSNMTNLTTIDFTNNQMNARLADSWYTLTSLTSVKLTGNSFCGCEPDTWKNVAVLHNAVSSLSVASSTCGTSNRCSATTGTCSKKKSGSMGLVSTAVAVVSVACALLSVLTL